MDGYENICPYLAINQYHWSMSANLNECKLEALFNAQWLIVRVSRLEKKNSGLEINYIKFLERFDTVNIINKKNKKKKLHIVVK